MSFKLGSPAPSFELPEVSGEVYSLQKDLKERPGWRLIVFFRGAWCPVCVQDLKELEESRSYFEQKDVYFTAISTDKPENLLSLKEENDLSFPVLSDEALNLVSEYGVHYHGDDAPYEDHGVHGEAAYFLLDEQGEVLYQQRQTSPFGRPSAKELRKIVQYIRKNLKK